MGKKNISLQKKENNGAVERQKLIYRIVIGVVTGILAIVIGVAIVMTAFPDLGKDDGSSSSSKASSSETEDNDNTVDIGDLAGDLD